jgi:hypothetical protein
MQDLDPCPDIFLEEVLGMPPDFDIEFVIELLPGTTPICKNPYRMSTPQLMELKDHIWEIEGKGYIRSLPIAVGSPGLICP